MAEVVEIDKQKASIEAAQSYELLLHSLCHQQTQSYLDRHVLLFEKWCRDYSEGIYIRDLKYVNQLLHTFRERFLVNPALFRKVFTTVTNLCAKPLLECKANERRSKSSIENISQFYREVTSMFALGDAKIKAEVGRCFRCIVHGGKDPALLRADQVEWVSDGNKIQLLDTHFIQALLRDSGALESIVEEFLDAVDNFQVSLQEYNSIQSYLGTSQKEETDAKLNRGRSGDSDDDEFSVDSRPSVLSPSTSAQASPVGSPNQAVQSTKSADYLGSDEFDPARLEALKLDVNSGLGLAQVMLDLCMDFAAFDLSASMMCGFRVCDGIIRLLGIGMDEGRREKRDSRMPVAVDLMWTVVDSYLAQGKSLNKFDKYVEAEVMDFEDAVAVLLDILLQLLREGYRLSDKECRNEVAIVLTLLINFPAASPFFVQSGLLMTFVTYACVAESGRRAWPFFPRPLAKSRNFANSFDIDIQFKQILWMAISDILDLNDSEALTIVAASPLVPVLMLYLEQDSLEPSKASSVFEAVASVTQSMDDHTSSNGTVRLAGAHSPVRAGTESHFIQSLSLPQLRELQVQAVNFLAKNSCKIVGEFLRIDGVSRILGITYKYCQSPLPEHKALIYNSILMLKRCVLGSNIVKLALAQENAIQTLLFLLEFSDEEATRALAARLTSILCSGPNRVCQEQLRNQDGVRCLVQAMNAYSHSRKPLVGRKAGVVLPNKGEGNFEDPCEDFRSGDVPVLIVGVLDCIRSGIVGHAKNEVCLSNEEGVDKLIELLEVSPFVLRTPVLRLLSDLLENKLLMSVLQAWRSRKTLRSSAQILAHCWLDEEFRLDGMREKGVLANLSDPLGNHSWPIDPRIPTASDAGPKDLSDENGRSLTVSKLAAAIAEGRNVGLGSVPLHIRGNVLEKDVRVILSNIFLQIGVYSTGSTEEELLNTMSAVEEEPSGALDDGSVGSDLDEQPIISNSGESKLSPSDYQVLSVAQRYLVLKEGGWWREVLTQLQQAGILPIEADSAMIERHMEKAFDATMSAQLEQMELQAEEKRLKQRDEKGFNDQIITQKHHQIKSEWLKRNRKNKAVAASHTKKVF